MKPEPDIAAILKRAEAATAAGKGEPTLDDCIGPMIFAFPPKDERGARIRVLAHRARDVEASAADVPVLCARVTELEAALRRLADACDEDGDCPGERTSLGVANARAALGGGE